MALKVTPDNPSEEKTYEIYYIEWGETGQGEQQVVRTLAGSMEEAIQFIRSPEPEDLTPKTIVRAELVEDPACF